MTDTGTLTLTEFLTARIAEDEATAISAARYYASADPTSRRWEYANGSEVHLADEPQAYITCDTEGLTPAVEPHHGPHIARHDPARVLAECEAKRRIVLSAQDFERGAALGPAVSDAHAEARLTAANLYDEVMRHLAMPYADHPDYNPNWRQ